MLTWTKRDELFGRPWRARPDGQLELDPTWGPAHLTKVRFQGIEYVCHVRVREPFLALIEAWTTSGLMHHVRTLDRFWEWQTAVDGTRMRRHCHGHAFDLNAAWNPIGARAHAGIGGTLPLLEVARALGWACGADRGPVAKHFELERL